MGEEGGWSAAVSRLFFLRISFVVCVYLSSYVTFSSLSRPSDMLFLQGSEVIFKVALSLLGSHKPLILQHESLESIVDFIKTMLPKLGLVQMEKTINQVRKTHNEDPIVSSFPLSGRADWNFKRKSCFFRLRLGLLNEVVMRRSQFSELMVRFTLLLIQQSSCHVQFKCLVWFVIVRMHKSVGFYIVKLQTTELTDQMKRSRATRWCSG